MGAGGRNAKAAKASSAADFLEKRLSANEPVKRSFLPPIRETEKAVLLSLHLERQVGRDIQDDIWIPKSQLDENGVPGRWFSEKIMRNYPSSVEFVAWEGKIYGYHDVFGVKVPIREIAMQYGETALDKKYRLEREKRFEAGKKSYADLIANAKSMGVKGVRSGMRRRTIEAKIAAFQGKG